MQTFTLREIAQAIASATNQDADAARTLHQQFRGWSQRGLLSSEDREGSAETSARRFTVEDACRARLLLVFSEFFGAAGDELRRLDSRMRASEVEPTANGGEIHFGLAATVKAIEGEQLWTLEVALLKSQADGSNTLGTRLVPRFKVKHPIRDDLVYAGLTLNGFVEVPATELLRPVVRTLKTIRD